MSKVYDRIDTVTLTLSDKSEERIAYDKNEIIKNNTVPLAGNEPSFRNGGLCIRR